MTGDTAAVAPEGENDDEYLQRLRREREDAMEAMLLAQEQEEQEQVGAGQTSDVDDVGAGVDGGGRDDNNGENGGPPIQDQQVDQENVGLGEDAVLQPLGGPMGGANGQQHQHQGPAKRRGLSYTQASFLAAAATIYYALRTRQQWYLALVFLGSSKWAFCVLGNACIAAAVLVFDYLTSIFLSGGLRIHEAEGLQDFFRWNVTETCLALTMFRSELTVTTALEFLVLIMVKCLHHVTAMREQHMRMTEEAVQSSSWHASFPAVPFHQVKVVVLFILLQFLDLWAVQSTCQDLLKTGPSVSILFAFEAAILLVSAWSHLLLWYLHMLDGLLNFGHDQGLSPRALFIRLIHIWKDHKATMTFAVELQAQGVQFLFYLTFFAIVLMYYGMPINLFREVYLSFAALKERLMSFLKYRQLMASMDRFANATEEKLEEAGRTCIICRDEMTVADCKQLPVCGHLFHKSCLREWLVQQQSCPTCRSDIAAMEAQEARAAAAARRAEQNRAAEGGAAAAAAEGADAAAAAVAPGAAAEAAQGGLDERQSKSAAERNDEAKRPGTESKEQEPKLDAQDRQSSLSLPQTDKQADLVGADGGRGSHRDKKVRFVERTTQATDMLVFPALYQVVKDEGTPVLQFLEADVTGMTQPEATIVFTRTVPLGVIVLCTTVQRRTINGVQSFLLKIPDGWIAEESAIRVHSLG